MIFDSNTTSLGSSIPMAEGYDCSYGVELALIESAQNDMAVFKAMLNADAYECNIRKQHEGAVMESQLTALNEATIGGIWGKIKELFSKLVAKVKAIFHSLIAKLDGLFKKDKELAKKYETEIRKKTNIGNLEVKWRKVKSTDISSYVDLGKDDFINLAKNIAEDVYKKESPDSEDKFTAVAKDLLQVDAANSTDLKEKVMESIFEDDSEETYKISEIGGAAAIVSAMKENEKNTKDTNNKIKKLTSALEKAVKDCDKQYSDTAKDNASKDDDIKKAQHVYEISTVIQSVILSAIDIYKQAIVIIHKQTKAAFMKMVAANDKKLEENALYLDMIAEAAEDQVDDVINNAIGSEGSSLAELNNASRNVLDGGECKDLPDDGGDKDYKPAKVDGSVDTDYVSRESAIFTDLLY